MGVDKEWISSMSIWDVRSIWYSTKEPEVLVSRAEIGLMVVLDVPGRLGKILVGMNRALGESKSCPLDDGRSSADVKSRLPSNSYV